MWVATFDQDSRVSPGFSDAMLAAYESCPFRDKVALIAPRHVLSSETAAEKPPQDGPKVSGNTGYAAVRQPVQPLGVKRCGVI